MNIEQEITKLTQKWYSLMGDDHHKDRDCHWYIETKWSYGYPPVYTVQHYGYILDKIENEFDSYDKALIELREILKENIEEEKKYKQEVAEENGW